MFENSKTFIKELSESEIQIQVEPVVGFDLLESNSSLLLNQDFVDEISGLGGDSRFGGIAEEKTADAGGVVTGVFGVVRERQGSEQHLKE